MEIVMRWRPAIYLKKEGIIYTCDLDKVPESMGIYVFLRTYKKNTHSGQIRRTTEPIYIGQATNLRKRIKSQLNSAKIMNGLYKAKRGNKMIFVGELIKGGKDKLKALDIVEKNLIQKYYLDGYSLVNIKSTNIKYHTITSFNRGKFYKMIPKMMKIKRN